MSSKIRVCVVEDDIDAATILCEGLRAHGYDAFSVHNGKDAFAACEGEVPVDLVLLDVLLPDIDGYQICRQLKANEKTAEIPVVFVTVKGHPEDVSKGYEAGAADYITKPYNLPMVMVRVDSVLRAAAKNEEDSVYDPSYTDQLTGLRNRRFLMERLQEEVDKAHRYNVPLSCIVIDVDEIMAVDDEVGPVSLDDLLAEMAMGLRTLTRAHDVLARFDGTVFAAVLPHTSLDHALCYIEKMLDEVDATTYSDPNFPTKCQISAGIVTCKNGTAKDAEHVLGEAMRALLEAKGNGNGKRVHGRDLGARA